MIIKKVASHPVAYSLLGVVAGGFGGVMLGFITWVMWMMMVGQVHFGTAGPMVAVLWFLVMVPAMLFISLISVDLIALSLSAFILAKRSFGAADSSDTIAVMAYVLKRRIWYLEFFLIARTRLSTLIADVRATITPRIGWRLLLALYLLHSAPSTVFLMPSEPWLIVAAEVAVASALVVWQVRTRGRLLVASEMPVIHDDTADG